MNGPLFKKILVPVDFSPCSRQAFSIALKLAKLFDAQILFLHVIDTKALEGLNALGLASPSEEKIQKKRLRHQARLLARGMLLTKETKGVSMTRHLSEGKPFSEITRMATNRKS